MDKKQIVLYKDGCGINASDLRALKEAGFIPLKVKSLEDVKVVDPLRDIDHGVIFDAALKAILGANKGIYKDIGCRTLFGQSLAEKMLGIDIPKAATS